MPPLKILIRGAEWTFPVQTLDSNSFAPFGEVINNPRPDVHPSQFAGAGPLPLDAVSANQGSAIKYQHVTKMVNRYDQAPSGKPGVAVMNMFVCAARKLTKKLLTGTNISSRVFEVNILERHPYTTQTFTPLSTSGPRDPSSKEGYLVIVAPSMDRETALRKADDDIDTKSTTLYPGPEHDKPDLAHMKAFIATTEQAVTYGAGIWHAPMVALGDEGSTVDFVVTQFANGVGNEDCEEVVLESPEKDGSVLVNLDWQLPSQETARIPRPRKL